MVQRQGGLIKMKITINELKMVREKETIYHINGRSLNCPDKLASFCNEAFDLANRSEEWVILVALDIKLNLASAFVVSRGTINSSLIHPREVYKRALLCNAAGVVLVHNHPSGDVKPSKEDVATTKRLIEAGEVLGIQFIDHIIVGTEGYCSLRSDYNDEIQFK